MPSCGETREMQSLYYERYSRIKGERKAPSFGNCFEYPSLLLSCAFNSLTTVRGSVLRPARYRSRFCITATSASLPICQSVFLIILRHCDAAPDAPIAAQFPPAARARSAAHADADAGDAETPCRFSYRRKTADPDRLCAARP